MSQGGRRRSGQSASESMAGAGGAITRTSGATHNIPPGYFFRPAFQHPPGVPAMSSQKYPPSFVRNWILDAFQSSISFLVALVLKCRSSPDLRGPAMAAQWLSTPRADHNATCMNAPISAGASEGVSRLDAASVLAPAPPLLRVLPRVVVPAPKELARNTTWPRTAQKFCGYNVDRTAYGGGCRRISQRCGSRGLQLTQTLLRLLGG